MSVAMRYLLVGFLSISLIVSGLPIAHAIGCTQHVQQVAQLDHGHHDHHGGHKTASSDDQSATVHQHMNAADYHAMPCKCLNCSSGCAAYVAPLPIIALVIRRTERVAYAIRDAFMHDVHPSIDPGIPIAT